jgi:hypothetical protein
MTNLSDNCDVCRAGSPAVGRPAAVPVGQCPADGELHWIDPLLPMIVCSGEAVPVPRARRYSTPHLTAGGRPARVHDPQPAETPALFL